MRSWIPNLSPIQRTTTSTSAFSSRERLGSPPGKAAKKEKKLDFKSEIMLIPGRRSPPHSRAWGPSAPQPPLPLTPGSGAKELLSPLWVTRQIPTGAVQRAQRRQVRRSVLTPAGRKRAERIIVGWGAGRLERTERAKHKIKPRAGMPGKSRVRRGARQPPLPLASPWPAAPGELKKKNQQTCTLKEGLKKKS